MHAFNRIRGGQKKPSKEEFVNIVSKIWREGLSCENVQSGFRATGIYPFDREVYDKERFDPAKLDLYNKWKEAGSPRMPDGSADLRMLLAPEGGFVPPAEIITVEREENVPAPALEIEIPEEDPLMVNDLNDSTAPEEDSALNFDITMESLPSFTSTPTSTPRICRKILPKPPGRPKITGEFRSGVKLPDSLSQNDIETLKTFTIPELVSALTRFYEERLDSRCTITVRPRLD